MIDITAKVLKRVEWSAVILAVAQQGKINFCYKFN